MHDVLVFWGDSIGIYLHGEKIDVTSMVFVIFENIIDVYYFSSKKN